MLISPSKSQAEPSKESVTSVHKAAGSIVSSVFRHVSQYIEEKEEILKVIQLSLQEQEDVYPSPPIGVTDSLSKFASVFVDSIINEALKKAKQDSPESELGADIDGIKAKLYPKTKEAIDSRPSVFGVANLFIDTLLSEAKRRTDQIMLLGVVRFQSYASVEDFKVKDGLEIVARCISKWSFNPNWYFKIIYNGRLVNVTHSYFYTVRWSVPTLSYPVAQVTADVYFLIEVFPMTPPPVHIQVCFRLETDCSDRCALKTPFLEKWLHALIKRKLEAFQMFKF